MSWYNLYEDFSMSTQSMFAITISCIQDTFLLLFILCEYVEQIFMHKSFETNVIASFVMNVWRSEIKMC